MFPPAAVQDHRGLLVEGDKTPAVLLHRLLTYMNRLLHDGHGHVSWPRLDFIRFVLCCCLQIIAEEMLVSCD